MSFVDRIARLCQSHPTRAKWIIVPTRGTGRMLGDRLTLGGTDWANLRFVTPLDLAVRMGAPFLVERGVDPSEEGLGPALMMRLLLDLPDEGEGYFRPLADQPSMAAALWSTLREVRMAGVKAAHLAAVPLSSAAKHEELLALVGAYEAYLERHQRGDRATVFEEALRHPDWCPILPGDVWTAWPDAIWAPLERQLIEALPGERLRIEAPVPIGSSVPRRMVARVEASPPVSPTPVATVDYFVAGGVEAEVEEVCRRIVTTGTSLDRVEIACASPGHAALVWEKAMRFEWPVTLAMGVPATLTRPGRALLGLAEWVEDDFSAGLLRRLLQSGDVAMGEAPRPGRGERQASPRLSPGRAARLLVRSRAAWGRDTYRLALTRLAASEARRGTRDDATEEDRVRAGERVAELHALAAWIDDLLASIPVADDRGLVPLQGVVDAALACVERLAARTSALDHLASARLAGALADLRALDDERCTVAQAWRFIRERVTGVVVGADRARPGHLFVSSLRDAGLAGRPVVFVVGLEEGRVFPAAYEDPVLLDDERERVHGDLRRSTDVIDEAVFAVMGRIAELVATSGQRLTLSYSCRDTRQFRDTFASWVMLHVYRLTSGQAQAGFKQLHAVLGRPVSVVPPDADAALSVGRWWLHGAMRSGEVAARAAVFETFPRLQSGAHAAEARRSDRFTEFDGHVPEAGLVLDPAAAATVVSPTALEGAAKCPFRYFVERGLGVRAIESGERSRDVWLDPLVRGSLLHDLYAACLRRTRAESRRVVVDVDRPWLHDEARRRLAAIRAEMPAPSADVEARETADLFTDLDLFLQAEADLDPAREPIGFEVSFGHGQGGDGGGEQLASVAPVEIRAGDLTFRVTGRVDRIDRVNGPDGPAFQIVDYKTGRFWKDDYTGTFAGGRLLQHALYGLAVTELLKRTGQTGRVTGAEYYFPSASGRQHRQLIAAPASAEVAAVLADIREVIASGLFVHAPKDHACKFCDLAHACGVNAHERATAKMADAPLEPVQRLQAHG